MTNAKKIKLIPFTHGKQMYHTENWAVVVKHFPFYIGATSTDEGRREAKKNPWVVEIKDLLWADRVHRYRFRTLRDARAFINNGYKNA